MQNKLRFALIQMHIDAGNPDANYTRAERLMKQAVNAENKPDVLVLPEMWNTGYAMDRIRDLADRGGERTRAFISNFCKEYGVNVIAGSIASGADAGVSNTILVFDRSGSQAADYSKLHLFRLMDEEKHLLAGERLGSFELEGHEAGMMICYDIRFPELARKLALGGAKLLVVPAEWPHPRLHHWRTLLQARAIENQMFVVACNRVGTSGGTDFFGHSMVIDPWGEVLVEGGEEEAVLTAEIDLSQVEQVRRKIPVFEDRRQELY